MVELIIELLAATGVIVLSLIWYFYFYPAMKKEYKSVIKEIDKALPINGEKKTYQEYKIAIVGTVPNCGGRLVV